MPGRFHLVRLLFLGACLVACERDTATVVTSVEDRTFTAAFARVTKAPDNVYASYQVRRNEACPAEMVHVSGEYLHVGAVAFRIDEVRDYALRGANLPLPGGRLLQAVMGLLVVAAEERARAGEDVEALSRRIAEYEKWTGRTAGR